MARFLEQPARTRAWGRGQHVVHRSQYELGQQYPEERRRFCRQSAVGVLLYQMGIGALAIFAVLAAC